MYVVSLESLLPNERIHAKLFSEIYQ